jgi:hypothetical protein
MKTQDGKYAVFDLERKEKWIKISGWISKKEAKNKLQIFREQGYRFVEVFKMLS